MTSYWFVPVVFLVHTLTAYWSNSKNFWAIWVVGALPLWAFVSKYSKDVVFDGVVFDVTMTISYTLGILYFTKSYYKLGMAQYVGLLMSLGGLLLFKKGLG